MDLYKFFINIKYFKTIIISPSNKTLGEINGNIKQRRQKNSVSFEEKGVWRLQRHILTKNYYTWILNKDSIELYCYKNKNGKKLSEFTVDDYYTSNLITGKTYLCKKDLYEPKLKLFKASIILEWKITGAHKNCSITTYYF